MINITQVVNISVASNPASLANYAINNLVCFTKETPAVSLGSATYAVYNSAYDVGVQWGTSSLTYASAIAVFGQSPNIRTGGGLFIVVPMLTGEVLEEAIARATGLCYYGGCAANFTLGVSGPSGYTGATGINLEAERAAAVAQTYKKFLFIGFTGATGFTDGGIGYEVHEAAETYTRCLFHNSSSEIEDYKWAYASKAMSTNFSGSNTTQTMNLKELSIVSVDANLTSSQITAAAAVGVDVYANIAGQSCVLSHGHNEFWDDIWNLQWLVGALEVAGFNYLRGTSTKIPQTEKGMDGLKGAYRAVLKQAEKNGFLAPGTWTGSDTFGDPEDFVRNISDFGYYIYSLPISEQSSADRSSRIAPVIQIAVKYAGAIHSTSVIINVNR